MHPSRRNAHDKRGLPRVTFDPPTVKKNSVANEFSQIDTLGTASLFPRRGSFASKCFFGIEPNVAKPGIGLSCLAESMQTAINFLQQLTSGFSRPLGYI